MTTYTIKSGETLTSIAKAHGTTVEKLAKLNNISNPDKIFANQSIVLKESTPQPPQNVDTAEQLENELKKAQEQLNKTQECMNSKSENSESGSLEMFGYGLAGAATFKGAEYLAPYAKKTMSKAGEGVKTAYNTATNKGKEVAHNTKKQVENFKKTAIKNMQKTVKKAKKEISKEYKYVKKANSQAERILDGKRVQRNGKIVKLGKAGKVLGKAAIPLAVLSSAVEITHAYDTEGTKGAIKQSAKCATGLAGGWAGAKVGAAIGTMICPGLGTAIGGFIGGIGGYILGEKVAASVVG